MAGKHTYLCFPHTPVEPVAVLVEIPLQIPGQYTVISAQQKCLEVGNENMHSGKPFVHPSIRRRHDQLFNGGAPWYYCSCVFKFPPLYCLHECLSIA